MKRKAKSGPAPAATAPAPPAPGFRVQPPTGRTVRLHFLAAPSGAFIPNGTTQEPNQ